MRDVYTAVVDTLTVASVAGSHVKKRIAEVSVVDAHAAKRVADGLEALILEVETKALTGIKEWPGSQGFEVVAEPTEGGGSGSTRIHLQLSGERYREVFRALCGDVCEVMAKASEETEAVRFFHRRLVRWQSFLKKHGPHGLSEEARCGLFGELLVLRDLLLPEIGDGTAAVRAWRGCKKAHQDFQFPDRALEVKTTRATIPDRISVSNVQQLDEDGMERLFLSVVHVHQNETTGETLPEMVDSVRRALTDADRDLLDGGLDEVGFSDAHQDLYSKARYQYIARHHFNVGPSFPRLTRGQIPDGVKRVRYDLSFDACKPFRIDEAALLSELKLNRGGSIDNE